MALKKNGFQLPNKALFQALCDPNVCYIQYEEYRGQPLEAQP